MQNYATQCNILQNSTAQLVTAKYTSTQCMQHTTMNIATHEDLQYSETYWNAMQSKFWNYVVLCDGEHTKKPCVERMSIQC